MLEPLPGVVPNIDALTTEDDTPVDNLPSEKQQRLLTEPLYSSWAGPGESRPFLLPLTSECSLKPARQPSCQICF